jgi:hypothetical protein
VKAVFNGHIHLDRVKVVDGIPYRSGAAGLVVAQRYILESFVAAGLKG